MPRLLTIGVYGFTRDGFLGALADADARLLLDVRDRRGVRGADYAWANARRLESALADAGIQYRHRRDLATPAPLREIQYREDRRNDVGQRSRRELAPEVRRRYREEVLADVDLDALVASLPEAGTAALLCVEAEPDACHRSLVAERLASAKGVEVRHLRPAAR